MSENIKLLRCKSLITSIPGQSAIDNGCLIHNDTTILKVGTYPDLKKQFSGSIEDLGEVTITPGTINAHCHLKLAKLRGKTLAGAGFVPWLGSMLKNNYRETDFDAVEQDIIQEKANGLSCIADIVTTDALEISNISQKHGVYSLSFCEAFGFKQVENHPDSIPYSNQESGMVLGAGHALYSTRPNILQEVKMKNSKENLPFSIHLAEHDDEAGMLMGEHTDYYNLLEKFDMLGGHFTAPMKSPTAYAHKLGLLDDFTLAVHCVKVSKADLDLLEKTRTNICLCPRSNEFIGVGRSPWEEIMNRDLNVCLGTDSIASNYDLNLWNELQYFLENYQGKISLEQAVALITYNPARALKVDHILGTIEPGKRVNFAVFPDSFGSNL